MWVMEVEWRTFANFKTLYHTCILEDTHNSYSHATLRTQDELSRLVLHVISPASSRCVSLNTSFLFFPSTTISTLPSSTLIFLPSLYQETSASSASTSISNSHLSCSTTFWPFSFDVKVCGYSEIKMKIIDMNLKWIRVQKLLKLKSNILNVFGPLSSFW